MKRIPALDGVRGITILLVIFGHYFVDPFQVEQGASLAYILKILHLTSASGVDLSFVLSGFLIGGILLDHRDAANYFSVFYARRCCRIFPAYFLLILLFIIATSFPLSNTSAKLWLFGDSYSLWPYAIFMQNFTIGAGGSWLLVPRWLSVTWSLAIEEQFYLTAPAIIRWGAERTLARLLIMILLLEPFVRLVLLLATRNEFFPDLFTFTRLDGLAGGLLCAIAFRQRPSFLKSKWLLLSILAVPIGFALKISNIYVLSAFSYSAISLGYSGCLIFVASSRDGFLFRLTNTRLLRHIGQLAYGLYLYHLGIYGLLQLTVFGHLRQVNSMSGSAIAIFSMIVTYLAARLSWAFIERRMSGIGHRFEYEHEDVVRAHAAHA
jgi:peptidoglycan/LPS O-acetylase OafA/YrhL